MIHSFAFPFLRRSLGMPAELPSTISEQQWVALHRWAVRQSLVGVMYGALQRLPADQMPPRTFALRWSMEAEHIRGMNKKIDELSAKLTRLFDEQGVRSVILKGSVNALLYPDPSLRQTGDVDVWLDGGCDGIVNLLTKMGLMDGASVSSHHIHLANSLFGESVEIHFVATSVHRPSCNRNLQRFLAEEISNVKKTACGFNVPSEPYALMMQLSHIQQHLFNTGIGLRQLVDYRQLLVSSSEDDRQKVSSQLAACGLKTIASAVMFALREVLDLPDALMLCKPDSRRGQMLLNVALDGGNFGWYAEGYSVPVVSRWIQDRVRAIRLLKFDARESLWKELHYWRETLSLMPKRVVQRRLALGNR